MPGEPWQARDGERVLPGMHKAWALSTAGSSRGIVQVHPPLKKALDAESSGGVYLLVECTARDERKARRRRIWSELVYIPSFGLETDTRQPATRFTAYRFVRP